MYVKKNLKLWLAVIALALPLLFVGTASAVYLPDGATQNATNGGWDLPSDMGECVTGIQADGTLVIDATIHTRPDCLAKTWPVYATQAACSNTANTELAAHFWASTCVATDGTPISMNGLDRTNAMCAQAAAAAGKTATGMANACTSSWQYAGRNAANNSGFCYAKVDVTSAYGTQAACVGANSAATPMLNPWSGTQCGYSYGINGGLNYSKITNMNGTTTLAAGATLPDLTGLNMGQCLLAGYTWNNYAISGGSATMAGGTVATNVVAGNWNCLRCHNSTSQNNAMAGRWKESYLKQGHKNHLRKVTAGKGWADPDGNMITSATGFAINNTNGTINVSGVDQPLYYLIGWMTQPTTVDPIYSTSTGTNGKTNGYSCVKCHSTGFSNQGSQAGGTGLCAPDSTKTTAATCTSPNTWFPDTGLRGIYPITGVSAAGAEPNASFPGIDLGIKTTYNPTWDQDGIVCSRCHAVTFPEGYNSSFNSISGNGHDKSDAATITSGAAISNLCYGCHQNQAKTYTGGTFGEPVNSAGVTRLDPTMVGAALKNGKSTTDPSGALHVTDLSGHATGGGFLNSPHARYTGSISPSPIGNYDIATLNADGKSLTTLGTFNSAFTGYICRSSSGGGGNVLETIIKSGVISEITNSVDCNVANGVASNQTTTAFWQPSEDGKPSCTICHDQHNSLFVASESEKAIKRECADCHSTTSTEYKGYVPAVPQINTSAINHPMTAGTPFDASLNLGSPCEICHMAKQAVQNGTLSFAAHLFRISTDPNYNTFPTVAALYGGSCTINPLTNTSSALCTAAGGTWTAATRDPRANASPEMLDSGGTYTNAVWVDIDMACGQCHGGSYGTGATHNGAPYATKADLAQAAAIMHGGTYTPPTGTTPVVSHGTVTQSGYTVSFTDSSTDSGDTNNFDAVTVNWGDGATSAGVRGGIYTHTYTGRARNVSIVHMVRNSVASNLYAKEYLKLNVPVRYNVTGTVFQSDGITAITNAYVYLKLNNHTRQVVKTATGAFSFANVLPGTYTIHVYKSGVTFGADASVTVTATDAAQNITAINP